MVLGDVTDANIKQSQNDKNLMTPLRCISKTPKGKKLDGGNQGLVRCVCVGCSVGLESKSCKMGVL